MLFITPWLGYENDQKQAIYLYVYTQLLWETLLFFEVLGKKNPNFCIYLFVVGLFVCLFVCLFDGEVTWQRKISGWIISE